MGDKLPLALIVHYDQGPNLELSIHTVFGTEVEMDTVTSRLHLTYMAIPLPLPTLSAL